MWARPQPLGQTESYLTILQVITGLAVTIFGGISSASIDLKRFYGRIFFNTEGHSKNLQNLLSGRIRK